MRGVFDAVVIGAGIVGAACASELSEAGLRVLVCEAGAHAGGDATAAGMGHLAVMDDSEAEFALTSYSQRLWRTLAETLPANAEYRNCGSIWVAADDDEMAEVHRKHRFYSERGLATEILNARELAEAEPQLRNGLAGGLLMTRDSVCYPPCAAQHLIDRACRMSGEVRYRTGIMKVSDTGVQVDDGRTIASAKTIIATGTEAGKLVPGIDIKPRKGHLAITDRIPGFLRHQLIELGYVKSAHSVSADSVAFNAQPRATGQALIGSSRQYGAAGSAIDRAMLSRMLARAIQYMPRLADVPVTRTWTGFRAATRDKLPLIGPAPGFQNVFLATGHEGLGIATSLGTARLLADLLLHRPSQISPAPYAPSRSFAVHA